MAKKGLVEQKQPNYPSFFSARLSSILAIVLLLVSISYLYAKNQELEGKYNKEKQSPASQPTPTLSPTPTPKPVVKGTSIIPTPTSDPDPVIECKSELCNGGWMPQSKCNQSTCCQIGDKWYFYLSKDKCRQDQETYWANYYKGNYYVPNYNLPPSYTYTPAPLPTYQPLPTPTLDYSYLDIEYQKWLEEEHQKKCQKIVDEWWSFKKDWYATKYNEYSSSAEAIIDLSRYKAKAEELLRDEGCSNRISLYEGNP